MDIREDLRQFVVDNFLFGRGDQLRDDDSFLETGIIDSTGILELLTFLEKHFGITLEDGDVIPDNLDSIEQLDHFVQRQLYVSA